MEIIFGFISKYFFDSLVVLGFALVSKLALKYFSNDRWETIKETILTSMLWAEETFGIGQGQEKWSKAWQKIVELLQKKGITLSDKEIPIVTDIMKSNVPEINSITYSALPDASKVERLIEKDPKAWQKMVDNLKLKYPESEE